jgi:hypothetical protein
MINGSNELLEQNLALCQFILTMWRAQLQAQERRLEAEKGIKYKGTASIKIEVLQFRSDKIKTTDKAKKEVERPKNVERLEKVFRDEGCLRLDFKNHIPAVIDQQQLDTALRAAGITADQLLTKSHDSYPELEFPPGYKLECLKGSGRGGAAPHVLPPGDKRWTVDLYLAGMDSIFIRTEPSLTFVRPDSGATKSIGRAILQ